MYTYFDYSYCNYIDVLLSDFLFEVWHSLEKINNGRMLTGDSASGESSGL